MVHGGSKLVLVSTTLWWVKICMVLGSLASK